MMLTIVGIVLTILGVAALVFEIRGIIKNNGFTQFGGEFIFNMIIGLLTLGLIVLGVLMFAGVIHS